MLDLNHVSMTFNPGTVNEKKALTDINPVSYTHLTLPTN